MKGDIGYFIKKESPAPGLFDLSLVVGSGVSERTLYIAEQLAFEEALGNGAHIYTDYVPCLTSGKLMYLFRQHIFACAVLPCDQDRCICRSYPVD